MSGSQHWKTRTVLLAEKSVYCVIKRDVSTRLEKCFSWGALLPDPTLKNVEEASSVEQTVQRHPIPGKLKAQRALVLC